MWRLRFGGIRPAHGAQGYFDPLVVFFLFLLKLYAGIFDLSPPPISSVAIGSGINVEIYFVILRETG